MDKINEIAQLLFNYLKGSLSDSEQERLNQWIEVSPSNRLLFEEVTSDEALAEYLSIYHIENQLHLEQKIFSKVTSQINGSNIVVLPSRKKSRLLQTVAAAVVVSLLGLGGYFFIIKKEFRKADSATVSRSVLHDVPAPKEVRAAITLSDGRKIYLDSAGNGVLAQESTVRVTRNAKGEVVYATNSDLPAATSFNTLNNPRGSKVICLTLSDGTKAWLNSESSLRYPTAFTGERRTVEVKGEAYFEVAHNPLRPFIVKKGDLQVRVLGTHFNVNTYEDEASVKVTLLEGKVSVSKGASDQQLNPGEQAQVTNGAIKLEKEIDLKEVMAWKNGRFLIDGADIQTVMRALARWYDLQVVYEGQSKEKFRVGIDRNSNLSNVLKILEATGLVRFKIEGRTVTVMP